MYVTTRIERVATRDSYGSLADENALGAPGGSWMTGIEKQRPARGARDEPVLTRIAVFRLKQTLAASVAALAAILLAGCSAHQRQAAGTPQPSAVQEAAPAPAQAVAATTPSAATTQTAQQVSSGAVDRSAVATARIGKSGAGLASWYGDRFHGGRTANGERFDMASLTAAHKSFPLPSYVRVTNVSNGRSVVVRVNDRGPYHGGRVIDVSKRAADVLGFRSNGVGNVKLDLIGKAPERSDDSRLLASYQEFGRPALPPGTQMAALAPVSDTDLAAESANGGGAYAVASRAVTSSANYVVASASAVASTAKSAASYTASTTKSAVRKLMPAKDAVASAAPSPAASETPAATAYAPPQPLLASAPPAIVSPQASHARRTVVLAEPALASVTPALRPSIAAGDVSSRIASSFDSFPTGSTTVSTGASVRAEATR